MPPSVPSPVPAGTEREATHYVAGFLFNAARTRVALVRKARPSWQAGRLNGIGGHIEPGESAAGAMRREFAEEAGQALHGWRHFATVRGEWGSVAFYRCFSDAIDGVRALTDEAIEVWPVDALPWDQALPNLSWLVPLALYTHDAYAPVDALEVRQPTFEEWERIADEARALAAVVSSSPATPAETQPEPHWITSRDGNYGAACRCGWIGDVADFKYHAPAASSPASPAETREGRREEVARAMHGAAFRDDVRHHADVEGLTDTEQWESFGDAGQAWWYMLADAALDAASPAISLPGEVETERLAYRKVLLAIDSCDTIPDPPHSEYIKGRVDGYARVRRAVESLYDGSPSLSSSARPTGRRVR